MTVYVDDWHQPARVGRISARWSHMFVHPDGDIAELHELAARIGMSRSWFQAKGWPRDHYDVTDSKRAEAIRAGAVEVSWREAGMWRIEAIDRRRAVEAGQTPLPSRERLEEEAARFLDLAGTLPRTGRFRSRLCRSRKQPGADAASRGRVMTIQAEAKGCETCGGYRWVSDEGYFHGQPREVACRRCNGSGSEPDAGLKPARLSRSSRRSMRTWTPTSARSTRISRWPAAGRA